MIWQPIQDADGWFRLTVLLLCIAWGAVAGTRDRDRWQAPDDQR